MREVGQHARELGAQSAAAEAERYAHESMIQGSWTHHCLIRKARVGSAEGGRQSCEAQDLLRGSSHRVRVFYKVDRKVYEVDILAIGEKRGERLRVGREEIEL